MRAGGQVGGQACVIDVRSPLIEEVVEPDDSAVDGVVNMKDGVEWRFMPDGAKVCERRRGGAENFKAKLNWGTGRYDVEPEKTPLAYFKLMMLDAAGMAVILPMIDTAMPPGLKEVVEVELFLWTGICIAVGKYKLKNRRDLWSEEGDGIFPAPQVRRALRDVAAAMGGYLAVLGAAPCHCGRDLEQKKENGGVQQQEGRGRRGSSASE